jgi:hypothetical protein
MAKHNFIMAITLSHHPSINTVAATPSCVLFCAHVSQNIKRICLVSVFLIDTETIMWMAGSNKPLVQANGCSKPIIDMLPQTYWMCISNETIIAKETEILF